MKNVFIIEAHPVMRASYAFLINRQDDMRVCGVASSLDDVEASIDAASPDLVVLNLALEGMAVTPVERLAQTYPDLPLVVVSAFDPERYADAVRRAGAEQYLRRDRVSIEIAERIRQLLGMHRSDDRPPARRVGKERSVHEWSS